MQYASWMETLGEGFIGEILKAAQNPSMISFAGGLPALELFPDQELQRCFQRVFEEQGKSALQYAQTAGHPQLREWIAQQHKRNGKPVSMEEIVVTTGSQQGLSLLAQTFLDPGDVVFVETPTYLGAIQAFQGFRAQMIMIPCDEQGIIPEELETLLKEVTPKFLYIIPNYQNPSGKVMGLERRRELLRVAQAYDLLVVEDNPYGELRFEGEGYPDLIDLGENVIYLGTFSKVLAPGLRVGYVVADTDIIDHLCLTKEGVDLHSNNLTQRAVFEFLKEGLLPAHIQKLRALYKERRGAMVEAIENYLGDDVDMIVPSGGLFLWARFKKINNSFDYVQETIRQNVLYVPGALFYPDGRVTSEVRLNYSCSTPEMIEEGVQRLARAMQA
ncbi:PLP-dependent aminotransferase family protein [Desulfosporosinus metallidurans]|uniref:Transcriptional regulator, GntR family domain / Aspartate aminotransferase n=1 Tax=Desulfosporosinus metallidurans TaxID=1888891 RepID=A0A1Q8QVZ1_9FIRM|nr:PLP-dependent aminotransferase family protein [Desulfosporosinus metallidurans]OLN31501.1 Transcriptional regulator, GntR family domain / Aspartate aminotransferase [Desulfosporosinus metallidurans]